MLPPLTINSSCRYPLKGSKSNTSKSKRSLGSKFCSRKMWLMFVFDEEEKELGRQQAPGSCPYCGGKVEAMDVQIQWRLCFLPMCLKIKRKFFCTSCARRLELLMIGWLARFLLFWGGEHGNGF
ncbi:hypothetical protein VNO78_03411 [Psophocarpus tetragonolobus]|uniref:Uncharacterized protein n=1 Tax=Psophocarpus tetragonolobus TaxID=3891 RepID=A0AAN9T0H2_PSOTE